MGRRRRIDLAELVDEPWIMQAPHTWNYQRLAEACHARGLAMPRASLVTPFMPVHDPFRCQGPVHHRMSEVGGALQLAESVACRFGGPAMGGHDRDAETSNVEPGGRALHRMRARGCKVDDREAATTQVMSRAAANCADLHPSQCLVAQSRQNRDVR